MDQEIKQTEAEINNLASAPKELHPGIEELEKKIQGLEQQIDGFNQQIGENKTALRSLEL